MPTNKPRLLKALMVIKGITLSAVAKQAKLHNSEASELISGVRLGAEKLARLVAIISAKKAPRGLEKVTSVLDDEIAALTSKEACK